MGDYLLSKNGYWWFRHAIPDDVKVNFGWGPERKGRPERLKHLGIPGGKEHRDTAREEALKEHNKLVGEIAEARRLNALRAAGVDGDYLATVAAFSPSMAAVIERCSTPRGPGSSGNGEGRFRPSSRPAQ